MGLRKFLDFRRKGNLIPGPPAKFPLGNIPDIEKHGGFFELISALHREYGSIARFWIGPAELAVTVNAPECLARIKDVTTKPSSTRRFLGWLGDESLTFTTHQESKEVRSRLLPILTGKSMLYLCSLAQQRLQQMLDEWERKDGPVDVLQELDPVVFETVMDCLFGEGFSATERCRDMKQALDIVLPGVEARGQEIVPPIWNREYRQWKKNVARLHKCAGRIIEEHARSGEKSERLDLVSLILEEKDANGAPYFSPGAAQHNIVTLLFGAVDTSLSSLVWACSLLARHPEVQARIQEEVERELQGQPPDFAALRKLTFLNAFIKESLRLYPPAVVTFRRLEEDLEFGGYSIPAGATFCISIDAIHKNESVWESPYELKPERFLAENEQKNISNSYVPFGVGIKGCMGGKFGMTMMMMVTTMIVQRFSLAMAPGQELEPIMQGFLLWPKNRLKLSVERLARDESVTSV